jgi:hypothetical protein
MPKGRASDMVMHVVTVGTRAKPLRRDIGGKFREVGALRERPTNSILCTCGWHARPPVYSSMDRKLGAA